VRESALRLAPALLLLIPTAAPAADCDALSRQLRVEALDQAWGAVLQTSEQLLKCDPDGPHAEKANFYRARALDRLRHFDEAFPAYRGFLDRYCLGEDTSFLCEDATVSLYTLAADRVAKGEPDKLQVLLDGLRAGDFYSKVFAGIQISKLPANPGAKKRALPVLVEAYKLEDDEDFRNEICLAIIRIDPTQCGGGAPGKGPEMPEAQWIKVRVWDCKEEKETVKVNMPLSFATVVIESLGPEVMDELKDQGFDLENLWESLKHMKQTDKITLSIDEHGDCQQIEIWFE
jgi:hypothetical protein